MDLKEVKILFYFCTLFCVNYLGFKVPQALVQRTCSSQCTCELQFTPNKKNLVLRIYFQLNELFVFGDVVAQTLYICFSNDYDFVVITIIFLIYKTLILFREKDLELRVAASGAQDPEKSVRIPDIF